MAKLPSSTEVLVAGAGPTGLTLAALLRAGGTNVVVVDRAPRRSSEARASVLHSRGIEILDTLGVAGPLLDEGAPINSASYYDAGVEVAEVRFDDLNGVFPFAVGIGQNRVEAELLERLADVGTRVHRSASVEGATDLGDSVNVVVRTAGGDTQEINAQWLVGCDGASSAIRALVGADGKGEEDLDTFVLATAQVGGDLDDTTMHTFCAPEGFCVLSPLPGGVFRLTANMADSSGTPSVEQIQAVLNSRGPRTSSLTLGEPTYVARYKLRRGVATSMRAGRVLLAGDAAHTFSPVGGQGMNTGLHDAANLAWKISAVCGGAAPIRLIETYDPERSRAADETFERTERLAGALTESNPLLRGARD
ncbi:MAG: FAD-dependent oxidoreductase, partial [Microthrixaceae bacterium]